YITHLHFRGVTAMTTASEPMNTPDPNTVADTNPTGTLTPEEEARALALISQHLRLCRDPQTASSFRKLLERHVSMTSTSLALWYEANHLPVPAFVEAGMRCDLGETAPAG